MTTKRHNTIVIVRFFFCIWALAYLNHLVPDWPSPPNHPWWVPPYCLTMIAMLVGSVAWMAASLK